MKSLICEDVNPRQVTKKIIQVSHNLTTRVNLLIQYLKDHNNITKTIMAVNHFQAIVFFIMWQKCLHEEFN